MTPPRERLALITGGAGFIATNVADRLLREGWRVRLFDNLSRAGVEQNVKWLYGRRLNFSICYARLLASTVSYRCTTRHRRELRRRRRDHGASLHLPDDARDDSM